jgi:hypothetical protein
MNQWLNPSRVPFPNVSGNSKNPQRGGAGELPIDDRVVGKTWAPVAPSAADDSETTLDKASLFSNACGVAGQIRLR